MKNQISSISEEIKKTSQAGEPYEALISSLQEAKLAVERVRMSENMTEQTNEINIRLKKAIDLVANSSQELSAAGVAIVEGLTQINLDNKAQGERVTDNIKLQVESIQKTLVTILSGYGKVEGKVSLASIEAMKPISTTIKNLIQELEDGVKVFIENQVETPVVDFTQGKIKGVDQAVPVILVDENGDPISNLGGSRSGGGGGFIGQITLTDPTIEYIISDLDESTATKYYGFLTADGRWYIMREQTANTYRYARGTGNYETAITGAWVTRAAQNYTHFHIAF